MTRASTFESIFRGKLATTTTSLDISDFCQQIDEYTNGLFTSSLWCLFCCCFLCSSIRLSLSLSLFAFASFESKEKEKIENICLWTLNKQKLNFQNANENMVCLSALVCQRERERRRGYGVRRINSPHWRPSVYTKTNMFLAMITKWRRRSHTHHPTSVPCSHAVWVLFIRFRIGAFARRWAILIFQVFGADSIRFICLQHSAFPSFACGPFAMVSFYARLSNMSNWQWSSLSYDRRIFWSKTQEQHSLATSNELSRHRHNSKNWIERIVTKHNLIDCSPL